MTENKANYDHRRYLRLDAALPLSYSPLASGGEGTTYVETRTVGLGGLMFVGGTRLPEEAKYNFRLIFQDRTLEFVGRIVYVLGPDDEIYQTGVEFLDVSSEDRDFLLSNHLRMEYDINMDQP
jgi:hypothetical protein